MTDITLRRARDAMQVLDRILPDRSADEIRMIMTSPAGRAMAAAHGWTFEEVAPDVWVDMQEFEGAIVIDMIESGAPGKGNVGRWLDSLWDRDVIVMAVISKRLEGILERRGFALVHRTGGHWGREALDSMPGSPADSAT